MRRVAITGVGLVTALGMGAESTWSRLLNGDSAVAPIRRFDPSSFGTRIGAEILDFSAQDFVSRPRTLRLMTRADQYALAAATLALKDAGWNTATMDMDRAAVYAGGSKEVCDPEIFDDALRASRRGDGSGDVVRFGAVAADTVNPLFYIQGLPGSTLFFISEAYGMTGANAYFAGTAEAGLTAIGAAYRSIRRGESDFALAGGFDDPVSWWNLAKIDGFGVLTDRNELVTAACRPFDRDRTGSVLGDGAAFLALEDLELARRRSAVVYAELKGFGLAFDNQALVSPDPTGSEVARAMRAALHDGQVASGDVDYVVGHGSATRLGDSSEDRGIRAELGAGSSRLVASAIKAGTGHLVAGAGALNAAVAALATQRAEVPPTLNCESPDPECRLDWVPLTAREHRIRNSVALARGIEGHAAALVLGRV